MSFKHPRAIYHDVNGSKSLAPSEIRTKRDAERYRSGGVITDPNEENQLYIRKSASGRYHFALRKGSAGKIQRVDYSTKEPKDRSQMHDDEVIRLETEWKQWLEQSTVKRLEVFTYIFSKKKNFASANKRPKKMRTEAIVEVNALKYSIGREATRYANRTQYMRHDLFVQSTEPSMSVLRPGIAIEVVHYHAPNSKTLGLMFQLTTDTPLIVLFYFLETKNRYFDVIKSDERFRIRCAFFMRDGTIYQNNRPLAKAGNANASEILYLAAKYAGAKQLKSEADQTLS